MQAGYLGVDIGGTKVAAGLVNAGGKILSRARVAMNARGTEAEGSAAVEAAIEKALAGGRAKAIGLSSPGPLDPKRGVVINPPNLPCWRNFALARAVERKFGLPTRLDNDANAAALAEARWGAGRKYGIVFYATLGTGIGAGLVLDGRIYHGRTGAAVEGGHVSLDPKGPRCGCGKRGCIEALASGPAVARRAKAENAEAVAAAWRAGDKAAEQVLAETAQYLAMWLGTIVDLLEPEVIIFGGGMGKLMAEWFPQIRAALPQWSINQRATEIPLRAARYGADAGIAGAAALCLP
ncbi:MAG: ROK family protein [Terriglobales bacterium]